MKYCSRLQISFGKERTCVTGVNQVFHLFEVDKSSALLVWRWKWPSLLSDRQNCVNSCDEQCSVAEGYTDFVVHFLDSKVEHGGWMLEKLLISCAELSKYSKDSWTPLCDSEIEFFTFSVELHIMHAVEHSWASQQHCCRSSVCNYSRDFHIKTTTHFHLDCLGKVESHNFLC